MNNQWKWVPVEPTREQRNAVCMHPDLAHTLYCSMVSAAPEPLHKEEAEVIGYRVRYEQNPEAEYLMYQQPEGTYSSEPIILLSDHRFRVARLTAEREALQERLNAEDQRADDFHAVLAEARQWLGDGTNADGLAREHWTPAYASLIDRIDAALNTPQ